MTAPQTTQPTMASQVAATKTTYMDPAEKKAMWTPWSVRLYRKLRKNPPVVSRKRALGMLAARGVELGQFAEMSDADVIRAARRTAA